MSINRVAITGNLTRDPELRRTQGGMAVLSLGVAVNDRRKNRQGEWGDYPNFVDCVMFGERAEKVAAYLSKGGKVAIEGKLRYSSWEDRDGRKRSKLEVAVDDIDLMSRGERAAPRPVAQPAAQPQPVAQPVAQTEVYDDDIPF